MSTVPLRDLFLFLDKAESKKISEYKKKIHEYKLYYFRRWEKFVQNSLNPPPYIIKTSEEWMKFIQTLK